MSLLDRLKALARGGLRSARVDPESRWVVVLSDDAVSVTDAKGEVRSLGKAELGGVMIETNDSGPWGSDFWWLLLAADESLACAFPQGATGEREAIDWLLSLPGFDHGAMIEASASTSNALFRVWKR